MSEICRKCKAEYPEAGDGWDGLCPNCADIAEKQANRKIRTPYTRRQDSALAAWRVSLGLSIDEMSKRLGVSRITWIRYERSGRYPNHFYPTMKKIAEDIAADRFVR